MRCALANYYSQNGEDAVLDLIFKNKKKGFFVEIGCIDGRRFSNTLSFEERGWYGVCIEANADYIDLLKVNRPNSIVCHCAAGETDEDAVFYANARGSLSTLDKNKEALWKREYAEYFTGFEEQNVKKVRISTLLDELGVSEIDILSLDIEGYEVEALNGLDLSRHRPRVMIIESDSISHEAQLDKKILSQGYLKSIKLANNIFYVNNSGTAATLAGKELSIKLRHTEHPLDSAGDQIKEIKIVTSPENKSKSLFSRLKSLFKKKSLSQSTTRRQSPFLDVGFHGDRYLLQLVDYLAGECSIFIETGSNVGSTLAYFATHNPAIQCFSCEPSESAYDKAMQNAGKYDNVSIFNGLSQDFIKYLETNKTALFSESCLFWLDAHGYGFDWPLREEIEFITKQFDTGFILIDDFMVPGREQFGYDTYKDQTCSYEFIKDSINPKKAYQLYYPTYKDRTSRHHPLRGWGLLVMGHEDFQIPTSLADKIECSS
jgi:FkbM family methyltransferase